MKWNPKDIGRISSVFDIATLALIWRVFGANTVANQSLFQSGWFVVGLLTQTLVVHTIRTPKLPFIESRAAAPLTVMTLLIMAVGLFLPMGPLAAYFKLGPLPLAYFAGLAAILMAADHAHEALLHLHIRLVVMARARHSRSQDLNIPAAIHFGGLDARSFVT